MSPLRPPRFKILEELDVADSGKGAAYPCKARSSYKSVPDFIARFATVLAGVAWLTTVILIGLRRS